MDLHLNASEQETFRQQGYIVKHNTVTLKQLETARDAGLGSLGRRSRDDPSTWIGRVEHREWDVNQLDGRLSIL